MAVNSFVENVNKLAISLYGDGTTPVDVSIITNNIEAITFLYDYISNGGEFGTIGASTVIENVSVLPSVSTEGTIVYLNTNNKLYVYNGASWDEVGGGTIESTGGSITVVGTKPVSATLGDIIYLTTDGFLYTWDGTEWDKVGGTSSSGSNPIFVDNKPTTPTTGDKVLDILDGSVSTWDGTKWVVEEYTPHASSMTAVAIVDALPSTGSDGDIVYNTTDDKMYVYLNGAWVAYFETITPNASGTGIGIVAELPLTATDGTVVFNSTDKKLYERVSGAWVAVVEATTAATDVADASITIAKFAAGIRPVETLSALPTTGNSVGRMVYLTTDGQLYRYTASGFTTAVPAQAITGTITDTQIGTDAITTPKIAAGAITADEIGANAITVGKIAALAVTAGTIQAGAVSATEIASNAITTDKIYSGAITAVKLSANSVDATKIVAGSIGASLIAANAINAGHISAGAIGAREISAGAITADKIASKSITAAQIQAGAISATEIASYAITANKIATGAITVDKISSGTTYLSSGSFALGGTSTVASYGTITAFTSNTSTKWAMLATSTAGNAAAICTTSPSVGNDGFAGGFYNSVDANFVNHRSYAVFCKPDIAGTIKNVTSGKGADIGSTGAWGIYVYGTIAPFTGSHDALLLKSEDIITGDIVVDTGFTVNLSVSDCITKVTKSAMTKQKSVVGVYVDKINTIPIALAEKVKDSKGMDTYRVCDIYEPLMLTHSTVSINSVGEGMINVCGQNGNIEVGDFITTSNIAGKGMKQDDDLMHSYTVAKAREAVSFSTPSEIKMIACTYHCG